MNLDRKQNRTEQGNLPSPGELMNLIDCADKRDDPVVVALMKNIALDPTDKGLIRDLMERIQPALIRKSLNPDPFSPNPKGSDVDGLIKIGRVKRTHAPFGLSPRQTQPAHPNRRKVRQR